MADLFSGFKRVSSHPASILWWCRCSLGMWSTVYGRGKLRKVVPIHWLCLYVTCTECLHIEACRPETFLTNDFISRVVTFFSWLCRSFMVYKAALQPLTLHQIESKQISQAKQRNQLDDTSEHPWNVFDCRDEYRNASSHFGGFVHCIWCSSPSETCPWSSCCIWHRAMVVWNKNEWKQAHESSWQHSAGNISCGQICGQTIHRNSWIARTRKVLSFSAISSQSSLWICQHWIAAHCQSFLGSVCAPVCVPINVGAVGFAGQEWVTPGNIWHSTWSQLWYNRAKLASRSLFLWRWQLHTELPNYWDLESSD